MYIYRPSDFIKYLRHKKFPSLGDDYKLNTSTFKVMSAAIGSYWLQFTTRYEFLTAKCIEGLGLPRLSTYVNTRNWCMAQRALLQTGNTAHAVTGLLDRAARYSGSPVDPGQPSGISPTAGPSSFGSMAGAPSPLLLTKGKFTSSALVPLAPYIPPRFGKRLLRSLQQRGLITLGDLTHAPTGGTRQWLSPDIQAAILPFPPPAFPPYPPDQHPPPRAGQFWVLKGSSFTWGGIYQLVRIASSPTMEHTVQRWAPHGARPLLRHIPTVGSLLRPIGSPRPFPSGLFSDLAHHRAIIQCRGRLPGGTVLASFPDQLLPPPTPTPPWTEIFREHLDPQLHWRVYADGSWKAAPSPTADDVFLEPGSQQGGGCIVVTQDTADWAMAPIYILPFAVPRLSAEYGGVPQTMELLAISAGLELLEALDLTGTVYSDCQGLVKKLHHPHVLRRSPASVGYPLIRACVRRLHRPTRTLQWTRSHPERSGTPRSGWDQSQWGIYLADLYARNPLSPPLPGLRLQIAESISYKCISEGAIGPEEWSWSTAEHAPLLGALRRTVSTLSLTSYLSHRDASRAIRGAPPHWEGTTARFAARIWDLGKRGIAQRGRKVRHIWDLRWHGENRAIADPHLHEALHSCELCSHPTCGLAHIICECPRLTHARADARLDLRLFVTRQTQAPASRLMQKYAHLLFEHPNLVHRGQLWLGHWPPPLRQELAPQLQGLSLRDGQATLLRIGRRAREVFNNLWDAYAEAIESARIPPADPDLFHATPPHQDDPLSPPSPPSSPPLAAHLWDARLAADNG